MLKTIITEMIQLTHSTQLRNNGVQSDLGYTLNRVQHYLRVLLELHKGGEYEGSYEHEDPE